MTWASFQDGQRHGGIAKLNWPVGDTAFFDGDLRRFKDCWLPWWFKGSNQRVVQTNIWKDKWSWNPPNHRPHQKPLEKFILVDGIAVSFSVIFSADWILHRRQNHFAHTKKETVIIWPWKHTVFMYLCMSWNIKLERLQSGRRNIVHVTTANAYKRTRFKFT